MRQRFDSGLYVIKALKDQVRRLIFGVDKIDNWLSKKRINWP
jgi:hypothetical protein